ncbi:hypothetical protein BJ165DRAFT_1534262 [Panaeolus papilionaceus]|nr:hypothetical protein BJ165DRAFT_1534262 [Panaeolus papilionaceus]
MRNGEPLEYDIVNSLLQEGFGNSFPKPPSRHPRSWVVFWGLPCSRGSITPRPGSQCISLRRPGFNGASFINSFEVDASSSSESLSTATTNRTSTPSLQPTHGSTSSTTASEITTLKPISSSPSNLLSSIVAPPPVADPTTDPGDIGAKLTRSSLKIAVIAGVSAASIVLLCLLSALVYFTLRFRKSKTNSKVQQLKDLAQPTPFVDVPQATIVSVHSSTQVERAQYMDNPRLEDERPSVRGVPSHEQPAQLDQVPSPSQSPNPPGLTVGASHSAQFSEEVLPRAGRPQSMDLPPEYSPADPNYNRTPATMLNRDS